MSSGVEEKSNFSYKKIRRKALKIDEFDKKKSFVNGNYRNYPSMKAKQEVKKESK